MPDGKALDTVTSDDATVVSASYSNGTLTVVLSAVTKDTTLNVVVKDATVLNPTGSYIQGAAIVSDGKTDEYTTEEGSSDVTSVAGDRKLSVIGQVKDSDVYGIIVSENAITAGNVTELPSEGVYQGHSYFHPPVLIVPVLYWQLVGAARPGPLSAPAAQFSLMNALH